MQRPHRELQHAAHAMHPTRVLVYRSKSVNALTPLAMHIRRDRSYVQLIKPPYADPSTRQQGARQDSGRRRARRREDHPVAESPRVLRRRPRLRARPPRRGQPGQLPGDARGARHGGVGTAVQHRHAGLHHSGGSRVRLCFKVEL